MRSVKYCRFFVLVLLFAVGAAGFTEEAAADKTPFMFLIPAGYDFTRLENQTIHMPAAGAGFLLGEQNRPFTEVERNFMGLALYQPYIFGKEPAAGLPKMYHQIGAMFDGRINRHQFLAIFGSASDKPVAGGLNTFQAGAAWGYEVVRRPHMSLILGASLVVGDIGLELPSGAVWPVIPAPLIRFNVNTQWFVSKFEFLTGPNLEFTVAPKERIRFTADMRMDNFRSIDDFNYEFTLWYRLFGADHKLGDFAGIGLGVKNEMTGFDLAKESGRPETFDIQRNSIFGVVDLSLLTIQGGWIFNSAYLADGEKRGGPGKGFFVSVQGMIPVGMK